MKHLGPILLRFSIQQQQNIIARSRNEILQHVVVLMLRPEQLNLLWSQAPFIWIMVSNFSRRASNRIYMPIWRLKILLLQCNVFTMQHCLCSDCFRLYKSYLLYMYPFAQEHTLPWISILNFFSHYQIWSPRLVSTLYYTPILSQNAKLGPGIILAPTAREKRTKRKSTKSKNST